MLQFHGNSVFHVYSVEEMQSVNNF